MNKPCFSFRAMKFCLVGFVFLGACSPKKQHDIYTYTLQDVRNVLDSQVQCWSRGNIEGFMQGYEKSAEVRFITQKGVKNNWKQILESYKKGYPGKEAMGNLQFDLQEVRWLDSGAGISQVVGQWRVSPWNKPQDIHKGWFSLVFHATAVGPKILVDCTW